MTWAGRLDSALYGPYRIARRVPVPAGLAGSPRSPAGPRRGHGAAATSRPVTLPRRVAPADPRGSGAVAGCDNRSRARHPGAGTDSKWQSRVAANAMGLPASRCRSLRCARGFAFEGPRPAVRRKYPRGRAKAPAAESRRAVAPIVLKDSRVVTGRDAHRAALAAKRAQGWRVIAMDGGPACRQCVMARAIPWNAPQRHAWRQSSRRGAMLPASCSCPRAAVPGVVSRGRLGAACAAAPSQESVLRPPGDLPPGGGPSRALRGESDTGGRRG